jgi:hypothetical protein
LEHQGKERIRINEPKHVRHFRRYRRPARRATGKGHPSSLTERSGGDLDPFATTLCASLLSLAQNIDTQRNAGKEISRNMNTYLDNVQRLQDMYPPEPKVDEDLAAYLAEAKA